MTEIQRNFRRARRIRWFIIAWLVLTVVVTIWDPRVCAAFACQVPLLNWIAHRIEFADVYRRKMGA